MGFASAWLGERALFPQFIADRPHPDTGIIIVIPAYNETGILRVLRSLSDCIRPGCHTEVIVVVNAPPMAPEDHLKTNEIAIEAVEGAKDTFSSFLSVFCINPEPHTGWGVGMARKTGMDEALRRFDTLDKPGGVLLCLDADCTVRSDYLKSVYEELAVPEERLACSIYFEHPLSGKDFHENTYKAIALYELHLRYYYQALKLTGFPYVFHTVGSAMAVKASTYLKSGGMNRKQAGEDFYFIQKLVPSGGYFSLNKTAVYPSPRTSFRVPFGTGATMERLSKEENPMLLTYTLEAFRDLRQLFSSLDDFYECGKDKISGLYKMLPEVVRLFSDESEWVGKIIEIRQNTSSVTSFRKRFFAWFNMFRIVKFLNHAHQNILEKQPVEKPASELLREIGLVPELNPRGLLETYRLLEKTQ